jgi:hypothetical protein
VSGNGAGRMTRVPETEDRTPPAAPRAGAFRGLVDLCREAIVRNDGSPPPGAWKLIWAEVNQSSMWSKWLVSGVFRSGIPVYHRRAEMLRDAARHAANPGLWLEFGVYEGASINEIARVAPGPVYGFDSFEGLPQKWTPSYPSGRFSLHGRLPEVRPNVVLVQGWFSETLAPFLDRHSAEPVAFLHVDCDLYSSTRTVLSAVGPRLRTGSVIVFDEFEGMFPDTEGRAFRELVRATGQKFEFTGAGVEGAVALVLR